MFETLGDRRSEISSAWKAEAGPGLAVCGPVVARAQYREYAAGWIVAAVVSIAMLSIPLLLETRAALALFPVPLVGLIAQCAVLRTK